MTGPNTPERRAQILYALRTFAEQRPGIEPGNYADWGAYRNESARITRDLRDVRALLAAVQWRETIDADALRRACRDAFAGRVTLHETDAGVSVSYCGGQYFPTEYRRAVAHVLGSALWAYFRDHCLAGDVAGDAVRKYARRELGARLQRKYVD